MRFYFIHIPKCAGNYIHRSFSKEDYVNLGHKGWLPPKIKMGDEDNTKTCYDKIRKKGIIFTAIRNPFNILKSWYFHQNGNQKGLDNCRNRFNFKSFKDFVIKFCDLSYEWHRPRMREYMYWQLWDDNFKFMPNEVLIVERLNEDLKKMEKKYNLNLIYGEKVNVSESNNEIWDKEMIKLVEKKCEREIFEWKNFCN